MRWMAVLGDGSENEVVVELRADTPKGAMFHAARWVAEHESEITTLEIGLSPVPYCKDCETDVTDLGLDEWYMVLDDVWAAAGMSAEPGAGFLCIGCIETRLGRALTAADFTDAPCNEPGPHHSDRLNERIRTA